MTALGFLVVGLLAGAAAGFAVGAPMAAARRDDDLAELHDRERQAARLRLVLGSDDPEGAA